MDPAGERLTPAGEPEPTKAAAASPAARDAHAADGEDGGPLLLSFRPQRRSAVVH